MNYQSDSIKELATALSQAQAEYPAIGKNRDGRFKYVDKSHIKKAIDSILKKHGLAVNSGTRFINEQELYCMTLMHNSGEYMIYAAKFEPAKSKTLSQDQERGSSMTYISRYLYKEILGVTIEDDIDDNDIGSGDVANDDTGGAGPEMVGNEQIQRLQKLSPTMQQSVLSFNKVPSFDKLTMKQYNNFKERYNKTK